MILSLHVVAICSPDYNSRIPSFPLKCKIVLGNLPSPNLQCYNAGHTSSHTVRSDLRCCYPPPGEDASPFQVYLQHRTCWCSILIPRSCSAFGQCQESWPQGRSNTGSLWFTDLLSLCSCWESSLTNLIDCEYKTNSLYMLKKSDMVRGRDSWCWSTTSGGKSAGTHFYSWVEWGTEIRAPHSRAQCKDWSQPSSNLCLLNIDSSMLTIRPPCLLLYTSFCVYRRIIDNVLELDEESLDINLTGNHLELKFTDGVLLPVVYIFETHTQISVLIATSNSVHRIVFPHPDRLRRHVSLPLFILLHLCCDSVHKLEVTSVLGL